MIATIGYLTALEFNKFVFVRVSTLDPTGGAYSAPILVVVDPLAGLRGALLLRGGEGKG